MARFRLPGVAHFPTLLISLTAAVNSAWAASPEWVDRTSRDGLTSALNQSMGNVIPHDFNGDRQVDLLFVSSDREPRLFFRSAVSGTYKLVTAQQLPEELGTTRTFRLGLTEDIDADGKSDLMFLSYFTFSPSPDAPRPPGVQLYLSSGAGAPAPKRLWRAPADEAELDRLLAAYFGSRQGFDGRVPTPEERELNTEPEPARDPVPGQNPLVRHSEPFGHSDKGAWADLDGDGMNELILARKEMRTLIYAAPSFDAEVVRMDPEQRILVVQQTAASTTERELGDLSAANDTITRGEYRKFKIKARTVDFPMGAEVRLRLGATIHRGTIRSVSSDQGGNLGLSKGRLTLEVSIPGIQPLPAAGQFRVNRLKRYTQVYAFGEEETQVSGNNGANARPLQAQRATVQVVDLNRDGRKEVVIVDASAICDPTRESEGNLVSVAGKFGCLGQSDQNARVHVIGYQASGAGSGRIVDWMNLPANPNESLSLEPSRTLLSPTSQAGSGVAFGDLNADGVLDLIVSSGPRTGGERRCLMYIEAGRNLNVNERFEEEVRWGCPFIAPLGRVDSADRRLNVAGQVPAVIPDIFRTRVFYGISEAGRLRFRAAELGLEGMNGPFENFEQIVSVGGSTMAGGADRVGPRLVLLRGSGHAPEGVRFDVAAMIPGPAASVRVVRKCRNPSNLNYPILFSNIAVRDMNRDSIVDLVFYAPTQDFVFYGDASGCFSPSNQAPITTRWFNRMAKADFNHDHADDLIVTTAGDTQLDFAAGMGPRLLLGGVSGLQDRTDLLPPLPPADTVLAQDLNGDQHADLLLTGKMTRPTLLLGTGGGFVDVSDACLPAPFRNCNPALIPGAPSTCAAYSAAVNDLNGDGKPDLILATAKGANRILFNLMRTGTAPADACTSGNLAAAQDPAIPGMVNLTSANPRLPGAWAPPRLIDAVTDLLVTEGNRILRMESGTNRIKSVTAGDFNGDGKKDLFAASGAYSLAENQSVGHELFLNRMEPGSLPRLRDSWLTWLAPAPQGSFPADLRSDSGTTCVQTNDINGDGVSDLLVVRSGNPNPVSWLNQAGSDEDQELADLESQRSSLADEQPRRLNAAQTGLDYPVTYRVRVLLGRATEDPTRAELVELAVPALATVQNSHPGTRSFDCRLEDVTGDGRPDLVLGGYTFGNETYAPSSQRQSGDGWSHTYWMNEAKGIQVLRNALLSSGATSFLPEQVTPIRVKNYSLEVLDWSGTGRMDIYSGNASQSRLLIRQ